MLKNLLKLGFLMVALASIAACNTSSDPTPLLAVPDGGTGETIDCATPEDCGWVMVWEDQFEGTALGADWTPQIGDGCPNLCGWGNQELQYYRAENATVADGMLTIAAEQEAFGGKNYTSSRLITKNAVEAKYGRIEARMKTPAGAGYWPAFWMLPNEEATPYGQNGSVWAAWGEIDIMESGFDGDTDLVAGTLHYGMSFPGNQQSGEEVDGASASSDFHTYAIEWEEGEIRWYYDGFHYATQTSDVYWNYYWAGEENGFASAPFGPFDQDFYIILNLAVGGTFPGPVGQDTVFPGEVVVDYVRVYECSLDTETGKGCASNLNLNAKQPGDRDVFIRSWDLYTDAVGPLQWDLETGFVTRDLAVASDGAAVVTEVAAEDTSRGMVVDFSVSAGGGSMQIEAADAEAFSLFNVTLGGEIKFDYYVDSVNTDIPFTNSVGLGSGALASGDFVAEDLVDQWVSTSIRVSDMTNFSSLDIASLFRVEVDSFAHIQFDNIQFVCGAPGGCGIRPPVIVIESEVLDVYIDEVGSAWPLGIGAFSSDADSNYFVGDSGNHISWEELDSGDPDHNTVIEASWGTGDAWGGLFIQADPELGVDVSAFATGDLIFDLRIVEEGSDFVNMLFKVDSGFPSASADTAVPSLDASGNWKTYTIPVASFINTSSSNDNVQFNISNVTNPLVIFPTFNTGQGLVIQLDNIRWQIGEPAEPPPPSADPVLPPAGAVVLFEDTEVAPWLLWDCCAGAGVAVVTAADTQRGQVAQIAYSGSNTVVGFAVDGDPDASGSVALGAEFDGGTLEFDALVVAQGDGPWLLKVESEDTNVNSGDVLLSSSLEGAEPVTGAWQHYTFPLDSGPLADVDFSTTQVVLVFPTWDSQTDGVIQLDNVHFAPAP